MRLRTLALVVTASLFCNAPHAADITLTPPAGGGVLFTNAAGDTLRFRVDDAGNSAIVHGGGTGLLLRSAAANSLFDIDSLSGESGIRFLKASAGQWQVGNRAGDDYLEIFEMGGGGSRLVIQDGTGNVGIGETNSPSYRLDVLHGGSTGIRSRSSGSFSVVDIDAASGDAALRFARAGVNQWNIRNRPADDYLEIFELGGGGSRMVIQDGTGNVGIGETTSPGYRLDVLHGGATGVRVRSSASSSLVDIDASSGEAAVRFARAGAYQWSIRNNPSTDALQFIEIGGGERMRLDNTTGNLVISANITATGTKAFTIDHPMDPENRTLSHAAIESNEVLNAYSGNVTTDGQGRALVTLPEYFESINRDYRYQLTAVGVFAQAIVAREIAGNTFEIATSLPNVKVSWEVKGVRSDARMKSDPFVAVKEKPAPLKGRYLDAKAWGQPPARSATLDDSAGASLTRMSPATAAPLAARAAADTFTSVSDARK